jgi:molecular chaperone DnaK
VQAGQFGVKLDYETVAPDIQRQVAGVISSGEGAVKDFTGYTVEFVNPDIRPEWRSGKIGLGPKGNFTTEVSLEKGKANNVRIELFDNTGVQQKLLQDTFQMTSKGVGTVQITLEHTVGVALANNDVARFLEKGISLPAERRLDLRTVISLKRGDSGQLLRVPVIQGDKSRADRNRVIGMLNIEAEKIDRDLPAGSVIEFSIEIDGSRQVKTKAFIPILGEVNGSFEKVIGLENPIPKADELNQRLEKSKERLKGLREKADKTDEPKAVAIIQEIDRECTVTEAERLVAAASGNDSDAAQQCDHVLSPLDSKMDDVEDALEWPSLVTEAEKALEETRKAVEGSPHATPDDKQEYSVLEREAREAIEHRVPDLLRRRVNGLHALKIDVDLRDPRIWVWAFEDIKGKKGEMNDAAMAERLFDMGERAKLNDDVAGLRVAVRELLRLLPTEARPQSLSDVTV